MVTKVGGRPVATGAGNSGILNFVMKVLFSILLLSFLVLGGSVTAVLLLIKRHRMRASDLALRKELEQIEREHPTSRNKN